MPQSNLAQKKKDVNMSIEETFVPISEIIRLAGQQGINLGRGNPENRLRYFIKIGLLPHAQRKMVPKTSRVEGHLPISILQTLGKINQLKEQGYSPTAIKEYFYVKEEEVRAPWQQIVKALNFFAQTQEKQREETSFLRKSFDFLSQKLERPPLPQTITVQGLPPTPEVLAKPFLPGFSPFLKFALSLTAFFALIGFLWFAIPHLLTDPLKYEIKNLAVKIGLSQPAPVTTNNYYQSTNNYNTFNQIPLDESGNLKVNGVSVGEGNILLDSSGIKLVGSFRGGTLDTTGENLLLNPGFEANSTGQPRFWDYVGVSHEGNTTVFPEGHSGKNSLQFSFNINQPMSLGVSQKSTLLRENCETCTLAVWVYGKNLKGGSTIRIGFGSSTTAATSYQDYYFSGSFDWKRLTFTGRINPVYVFIEARGFTSGRVLVDDLSMTEGSTTVLSSTPSLEYLGSGSLTLEPGGTVYPTAGTGGNLGGGNNRFSNIYGVKGDLTGSLNVGDAAVLKNNLEVAGAATVSGETVLKGTLEVGKGLNVKGSVTLGDASDDSVTFNARVPSSILPQTSGTYNFGSAALVWNDIYANQVLAGGASGIFGWWQRNAQALAPSNITDDLLIGGTATSSAKFQVIGSGSNAGNITTTGDLAVNGGDITTTQTTFNLINTTATTFNIGGAATTVSLGASTGTTTVNNNLAVSGASTFTGDLTVNGRPTFTKAPTQAHTGTWTTGSSTWNQADATIYINPASATADSNLIGVAVAGAVVFSLDAEGDIFGRNLILTGSTSTGTTTIAGDLSVEGNTTLGDSTTDTFTLNPATLTWAGGNKTIDITGAATRTLTLLNSTASQVTNLDLSDGSLFTASTSRLSNAGALENITGYSQISGNFAISGSGTFSTGTGAISLNGDVTIAANKNLTLSSGTGVISQTFSGTTQTPHTLTATFAPTAGGTQNVLNLALTNNPSTSANTLRGLNLAFTDAGTLANTVVGLNVDVTTANANDTTYAAIFQGGNVGIGDTSPAALLTVGSGDLFQVNSSGAIAAVVGITNTGNYSQTGATTFSTGTGAISLNGDVTVAVNKNLTLSSGTGVISQTFSGTTQTPHTLTATFAPTAGGTQNALNLALTNNPSTSVNILRGLNLSFTDAGTLANTVIGLNIDVTTANVNDTTYAAIFQGGNVGIGDTTPAALLTVGSGDLFQVNSSGAIAAATGLTSSGTITLSSLTTAGPVITSVTGVLSSEAQLAIARGGTAGTATPTAGAVAYGTGTAYAFNTAGSANQLLTSGGTGAPTFQNIASLLTAGTNISISGTTNATIATVANPTFSTSVTSPIFYDYNNTGYYVDPASGTNLAGNFTVEGKMSLVNNGANANYIQWATNAGGDTYNWYVNSQTNGSGVGTRTLQLWYYPYDSIPGCCNQILVWNGSGTMQWTTGYRFNFNGGATAAVDMRAPIFYDTDNTAYYVDPSSNSNFAGNLTVSGNISLTTGYLYSSSATNNWFRPYDGGNMHIKAATGGMYLDNDSTINFRSTAGNLNSRITINNYIEDWYRHYHYGGAYFGNANQMNIDPGTGYLSTSGYIYSSNYMQAPIFYDTDAGYYWDGNSESRGYRIEAQRGWGTWIQYDANDTAYYIDPGSTSRFNDLRGNIFYDGANTAYYVDPNGNSVLAGSVGIGGSPSNRLSVYEGAEHALLLENNYNGWSTMHVRSLQANATSWGFARFTSSSGADIEFSMRGDGWMYADGGYTTPADYGEFFYTKDPTLQKGDLVSIDAASPREITGTIERATSLNRQRLLGVISTKPGFVGALGKDTTDAFEEYEKDPHQKIVGLLGQVPAKVSNTNGSISQGDNITASPLPGIGAKATTPGLVVGKALEPFDPSDNGCSFVNSLEEINWPEDDGTNPEKPCFKLPDPSAPSGQAYIYVGKIMVFVSASWYDPDTFLTSTGDLQIVQTTYSGLLVEESALVDSLGKTIKRIGAFSELAVAQLKAGLIQTQTLITNNLITNNKIVSPLVETSQLNAGIISPLPDGDLVINLARQVGEHLGGDAPQTSSDSSASSAFGKLIVKGKEGQEVASMDSSGNFTASGSGTFGETVSAKDVHTEGSLTARSVYTEGLQARGASISGDLRAKRIFADQIEGATLSANYITNIYQNKETQDREIATQTGEETISESLNSQLQIGPSVNIATLSASFAYFRQSLGVLGPSSLAQTSIAGMFSQDASFIIDEGNRIEVLSGDLYLQKLRQGGVNIADGKVIIDKNGNLTVEGNVAVKGTLAANIISPLPEGDLIISLDRSALQNSSETSETLDALNTSQTSNDSNVSSGLGKLLVKGIDGKTVASFSPTGVAFFGKLAIATGSATTIASEQIADSSIGKALIPAGGTSITIKTPYVTAASQVFVTPLMPTGGKSLYIGNQGEGIFTVNLEEAENKDIEFNWWVIN